MIADAVRLCLGTLTVVPVGAPTVVDRRRAGLAMVGAPVAGSLVGAAAGGVTGLALAVGVPAAVAAVLAVLTGALATRFLHLDGLADTVDGWAASTHGNRARALEVMRRGDVGPAGAAALVLVLGLQVAAISAVAAAHGPLATAAGTAWAWAVSRAVLPLLCTPVFRPAREGGLGAAVLGSVPIAAAAAVVAAVALVGVGLSPWAVAAAGVALSLVVAGGSLAQARLGGLTGDVLGAAVEVTLGVLLVLLAVPAVWPPA